MDPTGNTNATVTWFRPAATHADMEEFTGFIGELAVVTLESVTHFFLLELLVEITPELQQRVS